MQNLHDIPIQYIKGIGPKKAKAYNKIGVRKIEDLLYYFPRRYEDRTKFLHILDLKEKEIQTIKAEILSKRERSSFYRRGFNIIELTVSDGTGKLSCVWFNQPYLKEYFKVGTTLILYGKIDRYENKLQMNSPEFEIVSGEAEESLNIGRIVPVYSLPHGITQRGFRQIMKHALDKYLPKMQDFLPYDIRSKNNLLNLSKSLINIHFPENASLQKEAFERLSFEEFFLFQLPLVLRKMKRKEKKGIAHKADNHVTESFIANLPFQLTNAQKRAFEEIKADMVKPQVMQRLLQGDVGSGKTVVATLASIVAIQGGYQVALMVPTEILAKQHFSNIKYQISNIKNNEKALNMALLMGEANDKQKDKIVQEIKEGKLNLVIGTHALLEEDVQFKNLGLVVIDEQHKFGVGQRALLPKKGVSPDVLIMTATPIPRTLAITLYGDLDISVINELPPGRLPVKTLLFSEEERLKAYAIAKEELKKGNQIFIVYPVIEESLALDIVGAKKMFEELRKGEFKDFRLGLIHGQLKEEEQDKVMLKFKNKELGLLVSTTVLEVGIDIPTATCMIVEHAERFGLSQLHQLRGRIGRGGLESFCALISSAKTEEAKRRLSAMVKYNDGFKIAEEDLKIRGPGEFFGKRQHGLTELKIANPLTQMHLLKRAREEAIRLISKDLCLELNQNREIKKKLLQRFPGYEKLMMVG